MTNSPKYAVNELVFVRCRAMCKDGNDWVLQPVNKLGADALHMPALFVAEESIVSAAEARQAIKDRKAT